MLRVGLLGDDIGVAVQRTRELNTEHGIGIVESPERDARPTCQFVIGAGTSDDNAVRGAADVWLDNVGDVDELWRRRVVPFATNLALGKRAPRQQRAVICDPDPAWAAQAARLITRLSAAIGHRTLRIDHIGSTSVPGLPAKDLIDVQVVVTDLGRAAEIADAAKEAGFVQVSGPLWCVDQHGTTHPEEVVVDADPGRPVNVNIRSVAAPIWQETLLFRDWLRASPDARARYVDLKRGLAARPGLDVNDYGNDKIPWISAAACEAEAWASEIDWKP